MNPVEIPFNIEPAFFSSPIFSMEEQRLYQHLLLYDHQNDPGHLCYQIGYDLIAEQPRCSVYWQQALRKSLQQRVLWMEQETASKILHKHTTQCSFMPFPTVGRTAEGLRMEISPSLKQLLIYLQKEGSKAAALLSSISISKPSNHPVMNHTKTSIHDFLGNSTLKDDGKSVKVYDTLHTFYKEASAFYDISMIDLMSNVLEDWMRTHKDEYLQERISRIKQRGY